MSADANPIDERRELVDDLRDIDGVLDVDFTRDGYRTLWVKYEKRGADDLVDDFDDHREQSIALLEADDVSAFFLVVERDQQTDFSSSVVVSDPVVYGVSQIQMLGAHFRTVLDNTGLETTELVESMVDEALVIDETTEEQ